MHRDTFTKLSVARQIVRSLNLKCPCRAIDLGCGDGVFLEAIGSQWSSSVSVDILANSLVGVDSDSKRVADTIQRLSQCFGHPLHGWDIRMQDALWIDETDTYDLVLGNPPWARIHDIDRNIRSRAQAVFSTAKGSFDICYLFVEKGLRLLKSGGHLAMIVPSSIKQQPAAGPLRELLYKSGSWSLERLPDDCFVPLVEVRPALLHVHKGVPLEKSAPAKVVNERTLRDLVIITSGVATGADAVFLVNASVIAEWNLEDMAIRPAIRGRDIKGPCCVSSEDARWVIWPYEDVGGHWKLTNLSKWPHTRAYIQHYKHLLEARPRLKDYISRHAYEFYRFIDPNRHKPKYNGPRIAVPDIFREKRFAVIEDARSVIMNSCFELLPRQGNERELLETIASRDFWRCLTESARLLGNGYRRTSASELAAQDLTGYGILY
jgi:hypothetical protein